jgi:hypothetical protein
MKNPLNISKLLPIDDCKIAIKKWDEARTNYTDIKNYIDPKNKFTFSYDDLNWVKSFKENTYFQIFVGVYNKQLTFIVAPVDTDGKVKVLKEYLYLEASQLTEDLKLIEEINIRKIKTATLSKDDFQLGDISEEVSLPYECQPSISENKALIRIQSWVDQALDWFYFECNREPKGERIFKSFKAPVIDLGLSQNQMINEVHCIFGFKHSQIHNMLVPVLNFIAVNVKSEQVKITHSCNDPIEINIADFASPCPPFCRNCADFS